MSLTDSDEHSSMNSLPKPCSAAVETDESRLRVDDIEMLKERDLLEVYGRITKEKSAHAETSRTA